MLEANLRKSPMIRKTERRDDALYLTSSAGQLRLMPQSENMIRISYTQNVRWRKRQGIGILPKGAFGDWDWEENEKEILLNTGGIRLEIRKKTGSITYRDQAGRLILAEREEESRELEEFDSYKTIVDENTKVEERDTPDGVKRMIKEASSVFDQKLYHTRLHLNWQDGEHLYGLGQAQEGVMNLRGSVQYLHQANMKIAIPFLVSDRGYGILLSTGSTAVFQDTQYGSYLYTEADEEMDYYFIGGGTLDRVIAGYRWLTGKAVMLPRWAFGFLQSQERYESQEELLQIGYKIREKEIGADALILDWCSWEDGKWGQKSFDQSRFPDPKSMIKSLHEMGLHFMISIWPNMNKSTENYEAFLEKRLLLPASEIYDAFQEKAGKLYWLQAETGLYQYGVDGWWCDSSEPFTPEWGRRVKPEPAEMYYDFVAEAGKYLPKEKMNAYGLFHAKSVYDGQRGSGSEKRVVNLTRSTYTGGQRYGTILWSGDISASWETFRKQIVAGLQFCASGFPYWTLDIGGFFVKKGEQWFWNGDYDRGLSDRGYGELFVRWYQYGAFLPIFRSHGTDVRREMWLFDYEGDRFYEALVKANRLRYSLLPYIYSWSYRIWKEDQTMMRMLVFDFAEDEKALDISDQFLFGESILVCPVITPMYYEKDSVPLNHPVKTRKVYLPLGAKWYDFYTDTLYEGGQTIEAPAEIDKIPLYIKAGCIIPMMEGVQHTGQMEEKEVIWHVYPGADAAFLLYEDGGDGYGYERGEYALTEVKWIEEDRRFFGEGQIVIH